MGCCLVDLRPLLRISPAPEIDYFTDAASAFAVQPLPFQIVSESMLNGGFLGEQLIEDGFILGFGAGAAVNIKFDLSVVLPNRVVEA